MDRVVQVASSRARHVERSTPPASRLHAATVETLDGRQEGHLTLRDGRLWIGEAAVDLDRVLLAVSAETSSTESPKPGTQSALRLVDGEVWRAEILGLEKGRISFRSPLLGQRDIGLPRVASLDFLPAVTAVAEPGMLYRTRGEPIPGKLVWIRNKDIAIDCPLGVVPVPRSLVRRFVLEAVKGPASSSALDEIVFKDGSLLRGKLSVTGDKLELLHEALGALKIDWALVQHLRRVPSGLA